MEKLEEVSRNELLSKAKAETITRYKKADRYKGFTIRDIDTSNILNDNTLIIQCSITGICYPRYVCIVELEDVLYWIQIVAEQNKARQINSQGVIQALMEAIDGMDIKIDCDCPDFVYRFAYEATVWGYKYGKPETRPAKITNPDGYGSICKHLCSVLQNKKWLQQVGGTVMDWCVLHIDEINDFLELTDDDKKLTLPNELARQNAKTAFYNTLWKNTEENTKEETNELENINNEE